MSQNQSNWVIYECGEAHKSNWHQLLARYSIRLDDFYFVSIPQTAKTPKQWKAPVQKAPAAKSSAAKSIDDFLKEVCYAIG